REFFPLKPFEETNARAAMVSTGTIQGLGEVFDVTQRCRIHRHVAFDQHLFGPTIHILKYIAHAAALNLPRRDPRSRSLNVAETPPCGGLRPNLFLQPSG